MKNSYAFRKTTDYIFVYVASYYFAKSKIKDQTLMNVNVYLHYIMPQTENNYNMINLYIIRYETCLIYQTYK